MKPNADEPIDRLVREALRHEADRPVPSFNPDRTWARLSQELQPTKAPRRPVAWLWAASLTGLLFLVGAGWYLRGKEPRVAESHFVKNKPGRPLKPEPVGGSRKLMEPASRQKTEPERLSRHTKRASGSQTEPLRSQARSAPDGIETFAQPQMEVVQVATEPENSTVVAVTAASQPKRRFQVMHINEYQAEEDAQPRLYRTESMVRLGSPPQPEETVSPPSVQIILPQRNKSN